MSEIPVLLVAAVLGLAVVSTLQADQPRKVVPASANKYDNDYAGCSAAWFQWALGLPAEGHPFTDDPDFDVTAGQAVDSGIYGATANKRRSGAGFWDEHMV